MFNEMMACSGGSGGGCATGEINVTAANQENDIPTGVIGIKRFVLFGKSTTYGNDDRYAMNACLWIEPTDGSSREYFRWVPCSSGGSLQPFNTSVNDCNKIQSVSATTGVVHVKFSATSSTAIGEYHWYAE